MTAITAPSVSFGAPRTRLRLTARGRRLLALAVALPLALVLGWTLIGGGSALASRDLGSPTGSFASVTVSAGDTLWSIAEQIAPADDPRDVVDALVSLNGVEGASLQAGQRIAIPAEYSSVR